MHEHRFCSWISWAERGVLPGTACPGVYAIARSRRNIAGTRFAWQKHIIYIGMTNSVAGLKGRLRHFDGTISGRRLSHGGADRVRFKHRDYGRLAPHLYVAAASFECNPRSGQPNDLRTMGEVARFEYLCLAAFAKRFKRLPAFNDKASAPKYSKNVRP